jgi:hypothetical protein
MILHSHFPAQPRLKMVSLFPFKFVEIINFLVYLDFQTDLKIASPTTKRTPNSSTQQNWSYEDQFKQVRQVIFSDHS